MHPSICRHDNILSPLCRYLLRHNSLVHIFAGPRLLLSSPCPSNLLQTERPFFIILSITTKTYLSLRHRMTFITSRGAYDKVQHESQVDAYKQREGFPKDLLESQLQDFALGDCKGLTVLDIGGGQGLRARQVIEHGAAAVDVVDCTQTCTASFRKSCRPSASPDSSDVNFQI